MVISIQPQTGKLTVSNVDTFFSMISDQADRLGSELAIDLRDLEFIDLFAMVSIAFLCTDLHERGIEVGLVVSEGGACGFLQRAGFFDILPQTVVLSADLPPARLEYIRAYRGNNPGLVEFTWIDTDQAIHSLLAKFRRILHHRLQYSTNESKSLTIMLSELCHNVLDHHPDMSTMRGVVAMQVYARGSRRFMQVVVGDRGLGIRHTLSRNAVYASIASDLEAIERSVERGVTEFMDVTHGRGLYHLLRLARQHNGHIHIRSGAGKIYFRTHGLNPQRFIVPPISGTQFSIVFPTNTVTRVDSLQEFG